MRDKNKVFVCYLFVLSFPNSLDLSSHDRRSAVDMLHATLLALSPPAVVASKPNMVWFVTDDQDQMLGSSFPRVAPGGATPLPKTKALMQDLGATAENFFIHTPICNPSRSELLSGRYFHNIKTTGGGNIWTMHVDEPKVNNATFARFLKAEAGYTCGMFGKYQNVVPNEVPEGFDSWLANGGGTYLAPTFAVKNVVGLTDGHWHGGTDNYTTAVVGNATINWIRKVVGEDPTRPFFAYVAPKAAHEPFNPAPWYEGYWDPAWPATEPRDNPAYNATAAARADKNGVIPRNAMITTEAAEVITAIFKNRWRTLMSVDDLIADVIGLCEELGVADNTYFFYSSDHGFQLGELNILMDKRHVYDWDTRIHLLARGPGIRPGTTWSQPATQVDMAATWLGLAGITPPSTFDGKSIAPLIISRDANVSASVRGHLDAMGDPDRYRARWRTAVFIEYYYVNVNTKCVAQCEPLTPAEEYPNRDSNCGDLSPGSNAKCWSNGPPDPVPKTADCASGCYETESLANNFIGLRSMLGSEFGDTLYAEYQSGSQIAAPGIDFSAPDFIELFNVTADKWMMNNLYDNRAPPAAQKARVARQHAELHRWFECAGASCP